MNVYDFDGTIYDGDSSLDFYKFCVKRHPCLLRYLGIQVFSFLFNGIGIVDKTKMKSMWFSFLKSVPDVDKELLLFWDCHINHIKPWYLQYQKNDDVIISASPGFLLVECCNRLGIRNLIASEVDRKTGSFLSENCHDQAKLRFFNKKYPAGNIDNFYSDSASDYPLAKLAKRAFRVHKDTITEWKFS